MTDEDVLYALRARFKTLQTAFAAFDTNCDCLVSLPEFRAGLALARLADLPDGVVDRLWRRADADGLGFLSMGRLGEFLGLL